MKEVDSKKWVLNTYVGPFIKYIVCHELRPCQFVLQGEKLSYAWTFSYWTAKSAFFFLTSDQPEGGTWDPNYTPGVDFLDHDFL